MYNIPLGTFDQSAKTGSVYDNVQTGYWEALKSNIATTWNYNPLSSLLRTVDQAQAYDSSNVYLKADDLNKEHAELGLVFKKDTRKGVVDYLVERKKLERKRQDVVSRADVGFLGGAGFFLSSLGTSFVDPVNLAASFVPVVGQARFANMVARAGLLRAISNNYKKKYLPPENFVNKLNKKFSPYCSVATWYLWRSIDNEPIQY